MRPAEQAVEPRCQPLAPLFDLHEREALGSDFALHAQHRLLRQQTQLVTGQAEFLQAFQQGQALAVEDEFAVGGVVAQPQRLDLCRELSPGGIAHRISLGRLGFGGLHRQLALAPPG